MYPAPTTTWVFAVSWLSVSSPSGMVLNGSTNAVLVTVPGWVGANARMVMVRLTGAPDAVTTVPLSVAPVQVTVPPASEQLNWLAPGELSVAEMNWVPAGSTSRTTTPKAELVPSFSTSSVYVIGLLVDTWALAVLSMVSWWKELRPPSPAVSTSVCAWAALSSSLPSATTSPGSTSARLV